VRAKAALRSGKCTGHEHGVAAFLPLEALREPPLSFFVEFAVERLQCTRAAS
jgi:hypothetical protein